MATDVGFQPNSQESPSFIDKLAYDLGSTHFFDHQRPMMSNKCSSESGASSADHDGSRSDTMTAESRKPGSWFYEVGDDGSSPVHDDEFGLRAALSARNITDTVEVPSSEHVAEIVGRQGCKIKALRAKTNTYIKTPIRGEEPVFTVTGRAEDVAEAKREIEYAADHFTQIRASRRHSQDSGVVNAPGHVTAYVRVPLRVVGLVVGPKGATIKRIQQDTHTYIITPSREREPIFEVTGLPQNVEAARKEIEQHIYQRTGNMPITDPTAPITTYDLTNSLQAAAQRVYGGQPTAPQQPTMALRSIIHRPDSVASFQPHVLPQPARYANWTSSSFQSTLGIVTQNHMKMVQDGNGGWGTGSTWSPLGAPRTSRDEGIGDSPPTSLTPADAPFHLMASIWTDFDQSAPLPDSNPIAT